MGTASALLMASQSFEQAGQEFQRLLSIMARLRGPDGCPWDREQTFDSIKPYTLEETYEVLDAIDARDWSGLAEELGDFILQAVFYSEMAQEAGYFDLAHPLRAINEKLIRRHPHVFGDVRAHTSDQVKKNWDEIKREEKNNGRTGSLLDSVSRSAPALVEAAQISSKAAGIGFDWPNSDAVLEKVHEELEELARARESMSSQDIEEELGDLLFTVVNLGRFLKTDPEQALRKVNAKFRSRFGYIEQSLREQGRTLQDSDIREMEQLWGEAKNTE